MSTTRDYLVFRLYGPMAGWGDIAVGEIRGGVERPSRSGVFGLLAAALGIRREEEDLHARLAESYGLAVAMAPDQHPLRDFHTVQRPPQKAKLSHPTRRSELCTLPRDELVTSLSSRDYYCDSYATVALWQRAEQAPYSLATIRAALERPRFALYLGRKSCPLALPVQAVPQTASDWQQALIKDQNHLDELKKDKTKGPWLEQWPTLDQCWLYSDEPIGTAGRAQTRRDQLQSRRRWQFGERQEYCYPPAAGATP